MSRPKNKTQLIAQSQENYQTLLMYVHKLDLDTKLRTFPKGTLNRNIRDVLAHLHHWHLLVLQWYTTGMNGDKPEMRVPGYTWRTVPDLNRKINELYKDYLLDSIIIDLQTSFAQLQKNNR